MTYRIPVENLEALTKKINFLARKAKKLGKEAPTLKVVGEETVERVHNHTVQVYALVEISGSVVKLNGWQFVASVEHTPAGNIIRTSPRFQQDLNFDRFRDTKTICEHCNKYRTRKDTFLVHNEELGKTLQVGRSCLEDFTGHVNPNFYAKWFEFLRSLDSADSEFSTNSSGPSGYDPLAFLEIAACIIRNHGYAPSSFSIPTKDMISKYFGYDTDVHAREFWDNFEKGLPKIEDQDREVAKATMERVLNFSEEELKNDFNKNMNITLKKGYITHRDFGLAAFMVEFHLRALGKEIEREERLQEDAKSEFVGEVKKRVVLKVAYTRSLFLGSGEWGETYMHFFKDDSGNLLIWKTANQGEFPDGYFKLKATIKDHREFKGVKQTFITRCVTEEK